MAHTSTNGFLAFTTGLLALALGACGNDGGPAAAGSDAGPSLLQAVASVPGAPTHLTYPANPWVLNVARTIVPNAPAFDGAPVVFSVVPALPPGVLLDPATGVISGSPRRATATTRFVVTATNALGHVRVALSLTVLPFEMELEASQGGLAAALHLVDARVGRLVDVYDRDPATSRTTRRVPDLVIGEDVQSDGVDYVLETDPATARQKLTILHLFGSPGFQAAYAALEQGLLPLQDKDLLDLPPFSLVPRNAAIVLRFDDLLAAGSVDASTVRILTGYPPLGTFEARVFADRNHGNVADPDHDGFLEFHATRVVIDLSISEFDASSSNPPLTPNSAGLPGAEDPASPNGILRLATRVHAPAGQSQVLSNLAGQPLDFAGNGSNDPASPTRDVVRAFRSGGDGDVTGDPSNGYLYDSEPPRVVGRQLGRIGTVVSGPGLAPGTFAFDFTFECAACARAARRGDSVRAANAWFEVLEDSAAPSGNQIVGVRARALGSAALAAGPAEIVAAFDPLLDATRTACFVRFLPRESACPAQGVAPTAQVRVLFSEPMDHRSVDPFDAFALTRTAAATDAYRFVVGTVVGDADARAFTFVPTLPLRHALGVAEGYVVELRAGVEGARDLAGNPLATLLGDVGFQLDPNAASVSSDGFVLRFDSPDELAGIGGAGSAGVGFFELRGAYLLDLAQGQIRPRPVTHFSAAADRTQPVPSVMSLFTSGTRTPLSHAGSKLQTIWRYCDVGFQLLDESNFDVDVEGLRWSPAGGAIVTEHFTRFEMSLSHARRLPDESVAASLLPAFPNSGLVATYAQNVLDPVHDPLRTVYPVAGGPTGYTVTPADLTVGPTGTQFLPWPMNRGVPASQFVYCTWRDTSLQARGGPNDCPGAELPIVNQVAGVSHPPPVFPPNAVPSIALPLLMEFRCYPDGGSTGANVFDISLAVQTSARPNFRAFSTGGLNSVGIPVQRDPDLEFVASGGFNPSSIPPGQATQPTENAFYIGQLDLVTRISRAHSIWFSTGSSHPTFAPPVVLPRPSDQPPGTRVDLAFRGATAVSNALLLTDAARLDAYGERRSGVPGAEPTFLGGDGSWKPQITALGGAAYFQVRITFVSNAETNRSPHLDALGFAYMNPVP